ncbi:nitroreductase [candidate division KSB1 bacterium 4484_87]|nr:MAG: nitroreductase [candidate division KSB1 bacterium 4484_87]
MEFFDLIASRYSVRAYRQDEVEKEKLQRILAAAQIAPTANNQQPFRIIVISTQGKEEELLRIYHRSWFVQPPLILCVCALPKMAWTRRDGKNYAEVDATIAMDHLVLAAADEGLGTCWVAAFDPQAAKEILDLPDDVEVIAFTPLGYPADAPRTKKRMDVSELVYFEKWGK